MHALLLVLVLGAGSAAIPAPAPRPQHIDVDEDEVIEGTGANPDGEAAFARKRARFERLIVLRRDFDRELMRAGDGL